MRSPALSQPVPLDDDALEMLDDLVRLLNTAWHLPNDPSTLWDRKRALREAIWCTHATVARVTVPF